MKVEHLMEQAYDTPEEVPDENWRILDLVDSENDIVPLWNLCIDETGMSTGHPTGLARIFPMEELEHFHRFCKKERKSAWGIIADMCDMAREGRFDHRYFYFGDFDHICSFDSLRDKMALKWGSPIDFKALCRWVEETGVRSTRQAERRRKRTVG